MTHLDRIIIGKELALRPTPPNTAIAAVRADDMLVIPPEPRVASPVKEISDYFAILATGGDPESGVWINTDGPIPSTGPVLFFTTIRSPEDAAGVVRPDVFPRGPIDRFRGYSLELYGIPIKGDHPNPSPRQWRLQYESETWSSTHTIAMYRERIRHGTSNLTAEGLMLPAGDRWHYRAGIFGWGLPYTTSDVQKAHHGLALLGLLSEVEASRRGKHIGDGATWPGGVPDFLDDLWATLEKRQKSTSTPWGHNPTSREFRAAMRNTAAPRTMSDWLVKAGLRPQDIKSGAVTRSNYPQFVAKKGR